MPGAELAYVDGDGYNWKVLTLRKGRLVVAPSPDGRPLWTRAPEESSEGYDFSTVNGQSQVVTNSYGDGGTLPVTVSWARYLWVSGAWAKQQAWTTSVSDEAGLRSLCHTFCGVDTVQL